LKAGNTRQPPILGGFAACAGSAATAVARIAMPITASKARL
jgi:hypothetical protein